MAENDRRLDLECPDGLQDEITSVARLRRIPLRPEIPARLRGRSFAIIEAAVIGAERDAVDLLRPLRALGPEIDTFAMRPMTELSPLHMDPRQPMPRIGDGCLLADLPTAAVDAILATATPRSGSPIASLEVRHVGGALERRSSLHGALGSLDARFAAYAVGMAATPEEVSAVARQRCPRGRKNPALRHLSKHAHLQMPASGKPH